VPKGEDLPQRDIERNKAPVEKEGSGGYQSRKRKEVSWKDAD